MEFAGTRNIGELAKFNVKLYMYNFTLSCMSSEGTYSEGRAGGSKDSY